MATKANPPSSDHVASSFRDLAETAARLNAASDELAKAVAPIDAQLKKLNLGVTTWHKYVGNGPDQYGFYWGRFVGYAKVGGKWGLALSEQSGNDSEEPDFNSWLFNDAPRAYRIESIDHIPALLEKLIAEAEKTTVAVQAKTKQAHEIAITITAASAREQGRR